MYRNTSATGAGVPWVVTSRRISRRSHTHKKGNEWPERERRNKDEIVGTTQRDITQARMVKGSAGRGAIRREGGETPNRG